MKFWVIKKKSVKKKTKRRTKQHYNHQSYALLMTALLLRMETIHHNSHMPKKIQYYNKSLPKYTPFVLKDTFLPKFRLPVGMTPSIDDVCTLSLPDSIIDGIIHQSNTYAPACTKLEEPMLVDSVMERNPRWMHLNKYWDIR